MVQPGLLARSIANMEAYINTHDVQYVADDAVFITMSNSKIVKGREAIGQFLHFIYKVAFDARMVLKHKIITEEKAMLEGLFTGKHIGEIEGVPATQREVSVPIIVAYDLENGLIREARIYMMMDVMKEQLGVTGRLGSDAAGITG